MHAPLGSRAVVSLLAHLRTPLSCPVSADSLSPSSLRHPQTPLRCGQFSRERGWRWQHQRRVGAPGFRVRGWNRSRPWGETDGVSRFPGPLAGAGPLGGLGDGAAPPPAPSESRLPERRACSHPLLRACGYLQMNWLVGWLESGANNIQFLGSIPVRANLWWWWWFNR